MNVGMPGRRPTIRMVADHANVSRQTVSNAINAPHRVSADTLEKVLQSIAALDYRPDQAAQSLSSRLSRLIGIRVGGGAHESSASYDPLLREIVAAARRHSYRLVLFDADNAQSELNAIDDLAARRAVDGIILTDAQPGDPRPTALRGAGVPFVVFGFPWEDSEPQHSWVEVDGAAGIRAAVDHLVAHGRRDIAFLGWPHDRAGGDARRQGWRSAMAAHGLQPGVALTASADGLNEARTVVESLDVWPEAIVCASDMLALGAVTAVAGAARIPGQDVAVTGFDDSVLAAAIRPALTTLRQPFADAADLMVNRLVEIIDEPDPGPWHRVLMPELVIRDSTAPHEQTAPHELGDSADA